MWEYSEEQGERFYSDFRTPISGPIQRNYGDYIWS